MGEISSLGIQLRLVVTWIHHGQWKDMGLGTMTTKCGTEAPLASLMTSAGPSALMLAGPDSLTLRRLSRLCAEEAMGWGS